MAALSAFTTVGAASSPHQRHAKSTIRFAGGYHSGQRGSKPTIAPHVYTYYY